MKITHLLVVRVYPLVAMTSLNSGDAVARLHTCISCKVYYQFATDGIHQVDSEGEPSLDEEDEDEEEDVF